MFIISMTVGARKMSKPNPRRLRSLNGRLGYIKPQRGGGYKYVSKSGRTVWKDLEPWEIKAAKFKYPKR